MLFVCVFCFISSHYSQFFFLWSSEESKQGRPSRHEPSRPKGQQYESKGDDNSTVAVRMLCDNKDVGAVIGKAGATVRNLRSESNTYIEISKAAPNSKYRVIKVDGPVPRVAAALMLIANKIVETQRTKLAS